MKFLLAIWLCLSAVAAPPLFRAQNIPGGGFLPSDLPDLALWLDADDASTLTLSGSVVDEWRDKSGNGRHFTGSGSARPALVSAAYNGRDAIQFDGVNDTMSLGSSGIGRNVGAVTVYVAVKWTTSPTSAEVVFVSSTATSTQTRIGVYGALVSQKYGLGGRRLSTDSFGSASSSGSISAGSWAIQAGVFDYSNSDLLQYIDGTLDGSNTSFQAAGVTDNTDAAATSLGSNFGLGSFADVEVSEILVYHAAHDASTRAAVEAYLTR